ncbi:MAG: metallophosphoesterase family protein, partial [Candidatus Geothermarchaeales archaeon]
MTRQLVSHRVLVFAVGALLLGSLLLSVPALVDSQEDGSISGILYPRIGLPAFLEPLEDFTIRVAGQAAASWSAQIFNEVREYGLEILTAEFNAEADETRLHVRIPDAVPGLYDLSVIPPEESSMRVEPHSVSVMDSLDPPFRAIHISDTHYDTSEGQLHLKATLQRTIRIVNFLRPDFVLLTGDAINNPFEEFFSGFREELLALEVPIIVSPGNHDHAGDKNFFERYIAPWDGSTDIGPVHVVYLDTGEYALGGGLRPDQVEWLRQDLSRSNDSPVKIFMSHHPIFTNPPGAVKPNSGLQNLTDADVDLLVSIFRESGVDLLLHGHQHENWVR